MSSTHQEITEKIRRELNAAQNGNDSGLLPTYALLGEWIEALPEDAPLIAHCRQLHVGIEQRFEADGLWTEELLEQLRKLIALNHEIRPTTVNTPPPPTRPESPDDQSEKRMLLEEFVQEAAEHLDQIESALLNLEQHPDDEQAIHALFRSFHTIKGVSGFLQLKAINRLSHEVESLLDQVRNGKASLGQSGISLLLDSRDRLLAMIAGVQSSIESDCDPEPAPLVDDLLERVRAFQTSGEQTREVAETRPASETAPVELKEHSIRVRIEKMERLARELSQKLGKSISLQVRGEDTEVDRTTVEVITDPLVHMIRNAVDHGMETPEERQHAGKAKTGTIRLSAYHSGGYVILELFDDGRGLDPARIREKAIERQIIQENQRLSDQDLLQLIFHPGFSTAKQVTDLSGRGVGLDVVRRNIELLRGTASVRSNPGKGTTFTIKLPLTLAIIEGLIVSASGDRFIIPATSVRLALRPDPKQLKLIHGRGESLSLRGEIIPLFRLNEILGFSGQQQDDQVAIVIDAPNRSYGLLVDALLGKQEVVIKSLGPLSENLPGLLGGAILGDGSIAMILDPPNLIPPATAATQVA